MEFDDDDDDDDDYDDDDDNGGGLWLWEWLTKFFGSKKEEHLTPEGYRGKKSEKKYSENQRSDKDVTSTLATNENMIDVLRMSICRNNKSKLPIDSKNMINDIRSSICSK